MINALHLLATFFCLSKASAQDCTNDDIASCKENIKGANDACMNQSQFQRLVSSYPSGDTSLSSLRGTVDNIISQEDASSFVKSLPDFIEASGYDRDSNGRAYAAPQGYAALGPKELKSSPEAYSALMRIRERVRSTTEKSLNLCPGSLYIDFTTVSRKGEGGAHTAHADNCIHNYRDGVAICDATRVHPYPKRAAASILYLNDPMSGDFLGGQFYFANNTNNGEIEEGGTVDVSVGKMMYFTSGVENLHGALPVLKTLKDGIEDVEPKRVVMALWYVFDENLMEPITEDLDAPTEIFAIRLPDTVDKNALLHSMGTYLITQQNKPITGSWKVNKFGHSALHVLFKDHSAMFSIDFVQEVASRIVVKRHTDINARASLQYMLQESIMLHGVLDELLRLLSKGIDNDEWLNFDGDVTSVREKLPARQG